MIMLPWIYRNSSQHSPNHELLERVQTQLTKLYQWRWQWHARSRHEVCLETFDTEPIHRLHFVRFVAASEIMLYNSILMWMLALVFKIDPIKAAEHVETCAAASAPPTGPGERYASFAPLRRPGASVSLRDPAIEICRTFEWVTRHHDCSNEPTFLYLFPIGMAMTALQDDPASMSWIRTLLNVSPVTANYAQGENQAGFGFYLSREALLGTDRVQAEESLRPFSRQDMRQLGV